MKTTNKVLIGSVIGVAAIGAIATSTLAYRGDYNQKGPNYSPERHEIMEQAFENNDYNTWKEQMAGRGRVTEVINEENFEQFAEAHKLAEEGNYDEADQIRAELGLRTRNGETQGEGYGQGRGHGRGQGQGMGQGLRDGSCLTQE